WLTALREEAAAHGIPVPDIDSSRLGFIRGGQDSQRDATRRSRAHGRAILTSGLPSGEPLETNPQTIEEFRRVARHPAEGPGEFGQEDGDARARAVGVLFWHGREWVTPFLSLGHARAYFDHARGIGIDFDYGAYFDISNPQHPVLVWERLGQSPSAVAGSLAGS